MYLVSKYVRTHTDTTVLLSGEGADELAQGYIYFRDAPSDKEAHEESIRLLKDIYMYDGLRADRTMAAHGLELRCPFLDLQFTGYYLGLPCSLRRPRDGREKHLLRAAFDGTDLLPSSILWRHKEAFSDGVASQKRSLFTVLQEAAKERLRQQEILVDSSETLTDEAKKLYPHCPPSTPEAFLYRQLFERQYPKQAATFMPYFWMPRWTNVTDPSARFISHYAAEDKSVE